MEAHATTDSAHDNERWLPVDGYGGFYEVSDLGRVRIKPNNPGQRRKPGKILKQRMPGEHLRYPRVEFQLGYKKHRRYVHLLVIEAFVGPRPKWHEVNHIDGNKSNACLSNLEYVTHRENMNHASATGLLSPVRGERHGRTSVTEADVVSIRERCFHCTLESLASEYNVTTATISNIIFGRTWNHVPGALREADRKKIIPPSSRKKSRLTEKIILDIRARAETGEPSPEIAKSYCLKANYVNSIIRRDVWKSVP